MGLGFLYTIFACAFQALATAFAFYIFANIWLAADIYGPRQNEGGRSDGT